MSGYDFFVRAEERRITNAECLWGRVELEELLEYRWAALLRNHRDGFIELVPRDIVVGMFDVVVIYEEVIRDLLVIQSFRKANLTNLKSKHLPIAVHSRNQQAVNTRSATADVNTNDFICYFGLLQQIFYPKQIIQS